jgi:serine protease Do
MDKSMTLSDTYRKVRPACVAISLEIKDGENTNFISFGSGVCVDKTGIIVTAKHVITGYYEDIKGEKTSSDIAPSDPEFLVIFSRMAKTKYEVFCSRPSAIMFDAENDVAIMKISEIQGGWPSIDIPTSWNTQEGDEVATSGFPLRGWRDKSITPNLFSGIVSQIQAQYLEGKGWKINKLILDVSIHPGNSGGPVFDTNTGELIGIVSAQRLRPFNLSETINKLLADVDQKYVNIWTNIVECVPWTSFTSGISKLRKRTTI